MVRTTPEAIDLQRMFAEMRDAGDEAVVMEVSSHALALHRADAIHWAVAIFTNLTQDHLDFHPTMEDYFLAKRRLFDAGPEVAVINVDDPYGMRLAHDFPDAIRVGIHSLHAQVRARGIESDASGSRFTVDGLELRSPLPGRFNVLNVLGAVAAVRALGVDDATIADGLAHAVRVPGRFEPVDEGQPFAVLVDYAHTPDSLDNVLSAARPLATGRVIVVFGAGGDRDRAKRPLMGCGAGVAVEVDRRAAIEQAIGTAEPGDVVVVAGKGHEQGQEFADGHKVPFDDVTVAREALRARLVA
jgi:UDP-N-acetylmuramoyl-L-alanyl-D-glutamate--2,6-diaminopimelate ligase